MMAGMTRRKPIMVGMLKIYSYTEHPITMEPGGTDSIGHAVDKHLDTCAQAGVVVTKLTIKLEP